MQNDVIESRDISNVSIKELLSHKIKRSNTVFAKASRKPFKEPRYLFCSCSEWQNS